MIDSVDIQERSLALVNGTGYQIIQYNGQRIYQRQNDIKKPKKGSEIFVGRLPRDLYEDEIVPLFNKIGCIYQIRLMMDFTGQTRGFCFVSYYVSTHADLAIAVFNGFEIRKKKHIGVYKSIDNRRLFVGGIPLDKGYEEVRQTIGKYADGIVDLIMYQARQDRTQNRGYAFIEFENHRYAAMARRNLSPGALILWGAPILVDWADPIPEVDPVIMAKVRKLYIRNLEADITAQNIKEILSTLVPPDYITKIYKNQDYAFVHFTNRDTAEYCYDMLIGKEIGESIVDVMWARPKIYSKSFRANQPVTHFCSSLPPKMRKQVLMNKATNRTPFATLRMFSSLPHFANLPMYNPPTPGSVIGWY